MADDTFTYIPGGSLSATSAWRRTPEPEVDRLKRRKIVRLPALVHFQLRPSGIIATPPVQKFPD